MDPKQTVWTMIGGTSLLVGYRALRDGVDPIPQLAGIGATGIILLFVAEAAPKLAAGFAVLVGITFALNWDITPARVSGGGVRTNQPETSKGGSNVI